MLSAGHRVCALSLRDPLPSRLVFFCSYLSDREHRAQRDHELQAPPSSWQEPLFGEMALDTGVGSLT